jgi:Bacterial PH domain
LTVHRPAATDDKTAGPGEPKPQVFRSPIAVAVWWLWLLFAVGNLIDLAVQGRDHTSVVAAVVLVLVTGGAYITALRPRIIAARDGLTIRNPLRDHVITWGSVAKVDATDLVRVHCEWPLDGAAGPADADGRTGRRVIHAWAVHSSRRRQATAQMRAAGRGGRSPGGATAGSGYAAAPRPALAGDAEQVVRVLSERVAQEETGPARSPVSSWHWPGVAAVAIPAIALVIVILL